MKLKVNGDEREFGVEVVSVSDLLAAVGIGDRRVAVEVNRRIVRRGSYDDSALADGDVVEIVHFVGGGS